MPLQIPTEEFDNLLRIIAARIDGASVKELLENRALEFPKRTLQRRLDQLVSEKRLETRGEGRARRYLAPKPQYFETTSTPLFPALRSGPTAVSAAPRKKQIPSNSLREFIRDELLDRIARGNLTEGQRVVEATLVAEFAISATPVREAIRELVAMGVLDAQNNKGAFVREIRLGETVEAFEVRAALETVAARAAAPLLMGRCVDIRRAAEAIIESAKREDFTAFQEHNQTFHRAIVAGSGNNVLLKTWDSLFFQIRTRWTMDFLQTFDPVAIAMEHIPIVDALESGMPDLAASLMASHSAHLIEFLKTERSARDAASAPVQTARNQKIHSTQSQ